KGLKMTENQWKSMGVNTWSSLHIAKQECVCVCVCARARVGSFAATPAGVEMEEGASMEEDEGQSTDLERRIIVSSFHVSCADEEAKTAAVYPPSPHSASLSLLPSSSPPSGLPPNIKGSL
ncbi:hypothetical protein XENOCAPTIV_007213, partial [Xenoophorus captivus]